MHVDLTFKGTVNHTKENVGTILDVLIEHGRKLH